MHTILLSTVAAFAVAVACPSFAQEAPTTKKQPIPQAASGAAGARPGEAASPRGASTKLPQTGRGSSADGAQSGTVTGKSSAGMAAGGPDKKAVTENAGERTGSTTGQARGETSERSPAAQAQGTNKGNGPDAASKTTASEGEGQDKSRDSEASKAKAAATEGKGQEKSSKRSADKDGDADEKTSASTSASGGKDKDSKSSQGAQASGTADGSETGSNKAGQTTSTSADTSETIGSSASTEQKSSASAPEQNAGTATAGSTSAELSSEEKTRVVRSFTTRQVEPVENVSFSVSVGVNVPQDLDLHPVPADVVQIVPAYREYHYVVVDEQIVIVNPKTRKIVEVIEQGSTTASIGGSQGSGFLSLSREEETTIIKTLRSDASSLFREGATIPQCVELKSVPSTVDVPELRSYRYVVVEDSVILVEPESRRIVKILE